VVVALAGFALGSCTGSVVGAPPGSEITVVANPPFIVANGGVSVITAIVLEDAASIPDGREAFGTPVPDGTVVQFLTSLGRIDEQAKTKNGVARANLVSDGRSGDAKITVLSGSTSNVDITVGIGSALPAKVVLVADPASIRRGQTSYLTANVFDVDGNPVANVPIVFSIASPGRDALASGGRQVFTDSNGQAFDELRASSEVLTRGATVTANAAGIASDKVEVPISTS
jgi:hypothetical protein